MIKVRATFPIMFSLYKNPKYLKSHFYIAVLGLLFWSGLFFCYSAWAEEQKLDRAGSIALEIKTIIDAKRHPQLLQPDFPNRAENVQSLYELEGFQLLWFGTETALNNNKQAIKLLQNAAESGLSPERYDLRVLQENLATAQTADMLDPQRLAVLDTALSIELLRYMYDLHYGRVDPHNIDFKLELRSKKLDLPDLLLKSIRANNVSQLNAQLEPEIKQYQRLKQALAHYRALASKQDTHVFDLPTPFGLGKKHKQVPELRKLLNSLGDYALENKPVADEKAQKSTVFGAEDVLAVKNFQLRHVLQPSGVITRETLAALNIPLTQRINQIELAMERLRWLPETSMDSGLLVNIPAFRLWALGANGDVDETQLTMRVVVGEADKNQTPVLMSEIQYLDFMPHWNIPQSIVKKEILQKLQTNPGYLSSHNMEIVPNFDRNAQSLAFDESLVDDLRRGHLKIRQKPGKKNALGRVKFIFPNPDNVYLHDTPSVSYFKKIRRDFSHGCVRVENPQALAEFVLQPQPKWDKVAIQKAMVQSNEQRVSLPKSVPITIYYMTAFFDQPERLTFYPDIYGYDAILQQALAKPVEVADSSLFIQEASADIIPAEGAVMQKETALNF